MKVIVLSDKDYADLIRLLAQIERNAKVCEILDCADHCGEFNQCPLNSLSFSIEKHTTTID